MEVICPNFLNNSGIFLFKNTFVFDNKTILIWIDNLKLNTTSNHLIIKVSIIDNHSIFIVINHK